MNECLDLKFNRASKEQNHAQWLIYLRWLRMTLGYASMMAPESLFAMLATNHFAASTLHSILDAAHGIHPVNCYHPITYLHSSLDIKPPPSLPKQSIPPTPFILNLPCPLPIYVTLLHHYPVHPLYRPNNLDILLLTLQHIPCMPLHREVLFIPRPRQPRQLFISRRVDDPPDMRPINRR